MNNNEIIKETWKKVDIKLSTFLSKYIKINKELRDEIQSIFNEISVNETKLYEYASDTLLERFRRVIDELYDNLNDINKVRAKNLRNRFKIKNKDIYQFLIMLAYERQQDKLDEMETELFKTVSQTIYNQEIKKLNKKTILPEMWFLGVLKKINPRGYEWQGYNDSALMYGSNEIYRQLLLCIQRGKKPNVNDKEFKKIFDIQVNRLLNKKQDENQVDKFSGALDEELTMVINETKLKAYEDSSITKVRFIAEMDKKTTLMCESLNNQVFKIHGINKYTRYSDADKRKIVYITKGLRIGDNLPPINNHFHWCRSTITYQVEE